MSVQPLSLPRGGKHPRLTAVICRSQKASCRVLFSAIAFLVFSLLGCSSYQLGPTNGAPAGSRSLQVNLFRNETIEPRLGEAVGFALRRRVQQDGTYRLDTHGDGDIIINGVIIGYTRGGLTFQPNDLLTVRDFELQMVVKITAMDRSTGRLVLDSTIIGRSMVRVGNNQNAGEVQALPLLADDLAQNIIGRLTDTKW